MQNSNKKTSFIFSIATMVSVAVVSAAAVAAGLFSRHHKLSQKSALLAEAVVDDSEGQSIIEDLVSHNSKGF